MNLLFLVSALLSVSGSYGFHPQAAPSRSFSTLSALSKNIDETRVPLDLRKTVASIAISASLAWGVAGGAVLAADEFADFSLPSYEAVSRAELNSNLKGDKFLLGEPSAAPSGSTKSEVVTTPAVAEPFSQEKTADQIKAEKAARKAAEKEAREKQKAAVEAAAKAAS